jgi:hypothetical protein
MGACTACCACCAAAARYLPCLTSQNPGTRLCCARLPCAVHSSRDIQWEGHLYRLHQFSTQAGPVVWGLTASILIAVRLGWLACSLTQSAMCEACHAPRDRRWHARPLGVHLTSRSMRRGASSTPSCGMMGQSCTCTQQPACSRLENLASLQSHTCSPPHAQLFCYQLCCAFLAEESTALCSAGSSGEM